MTVSPMRAPGKAKYGLLSSRAENGVGHSKALWNVKDRVSLNVFCIVVKPLISEPNPFAL